MFIIHCLNCVRTIFILFIFWCAPSSDKRHTYATNSVAANVTSNIYLNDIYNSSFICWASVRGILGGTEGTRWSATAIHSSYVPLSRHCLLFGKHSARFFLFFQNKCKYKYKLLCVADSDSYIPNSSDSFIFFSLLTGMTLNQQSRYLAYPLLQHSAGEQRIFLWLC